MEDKENSEYFYKLFAYRQPYDCSPARRDDWKKSVVEEIKEFDDKKLMSSEKLRQSGKPLPNDLRYSWIKHNTEADVASPRVQVSGSMPDHLRDLVTFVPEWMNSVVPEVKRELPTVKNVEEERKILEKESLKPWPVGLKIFNDSSSLVDPKWSASKEKKLIKTINLSSEKFLIEY